MTDVDDVFFSSFFYFSQFNKNWKRYLHRNWRWPCRIWHCLSVPWSSPHLWQRSPRNRQCKFFLSINLLNKNMFEFSNFELEIGNFIARTAGLKNSTLPLSCERIFIEIDFGLFFNFSQLLFISGLACVIGPRRTLSFFFQRHKLKASAAFLGGVIVVLMGWPIVGMILETYGFVLLFR